MAEETILRAEHLKKYFPVKKGIFSRARAYVKAVDDITLEIRSGETLGVVGESGSGKSTLGRTLIGLLDATSGSVWFNGRDTTCLKGRDYRSLRQDMQIVFQDPYASLNPRIRIGEAIGEPLEAHGLAKGAEKQERVLELMDLVGLRPSHYYRFPHEFSGGQRQRIGIARALALHPKFIVCDEPVSALDVSIQSQILNLLVRLQSELSLTYMFISHDLRVVRYIADRVLVMYLGSVVEQAPTDLLYKNPLHPYTQALISAIPQAEYGIAAERSILPGDIPSPVHLPSGCRMHTRCPKAQPVCSEKQPELREIERGHCVACHFAGCS